jgi:hypothetical protein
VVAHRIFSGKPYVALLVDSVVAALIGYGRDRHRGDKKAERAEVFLRSAT